MTTPGPRVLITGAAGRLGSKVAQLFHDHDFDLLATDVNVVNGTPYPFEVVDLLDHEAASALLEGVDVLVHIGNHPGIGAAPPQIVFNQNVSMNENMFQGAVERGVSAVVFASTLQLIGSHPDERTVLTPPRRPTYPLSGTSTPDPSNVYALSKTVSETMLRYYSERCGLAGTALRFPMLHRHDAWVDVGLGEERPVDILEGFTGLTYDDAAELFLAVVRADLSGYHVFMAGTAHRHRDLTVPELLRTHYLEVPDGTSDLIDISAVTQATGWEPSEGYHRANHPTRTPQGLPTMTKPITIDDVQIILTQPGRARLAIVKVLTSEAGLYGIGCATFTQRIHAVAAALERHLKPFLIGRDVARIEEIWQMSMVHGYWRNGPVLNNAISGVDQALWDIKGKQAGMPVHDLLGGKCREGAHVYVHADGPTPSDVADRVREFVDDGFRYVRVQQGLYGGNATAVAPPRGALDGAYFDPRRYRHDTLTMVDHVRNTVGPDVELVHDVHERLTPADAVLFAKDMEQFRLFFLEDLLAPEDLAWFERVRAQCATPLAMGELFNHPMEWRTLIERRLVDFIRMHVSQMGGITPARKVADLAHAHGVRTAWHGPPDTSPVGHAANLHLDLWSPAFGIQEWYRPSELEYEMFPGLPVVESGYLYANDRPGLGIDIDERLALEHPVEEVVEEWTQARLPDGSPARP